MAENNEKFRYEDYIYTNCEYKDFSDEMVKKVRTNLRAKTNRYENPKGRSQILDGFEISFFETLEEMRDFAVFDACDAICKEYEKRFPPKEPTPKPPKPPKPPAQPPKPSARPPEPSTPLREPPTQTPKPPARHPEPSAQPSKPSARRPEPPAQPPQKPPANPQPAISFSVTPDATTKQIPVSVSQFSLVSRIARQYSSSSESSSPELISRESTPEPLQSPESLPPESISREGSPQRSPVVGDTNRPGTPEPPSKRPKTTAVQGSKDPNINLLRAPVDRSANEVGSSNLDGIKSDPPKAGNTGDKKPKGYRIRKVDNKRPKSPEASRPRSPEASRPRTPEASRPRSPEASRPRLTKAPRSRSPQATGLKSPKAPRTRSPEASRPRKSNDRHPHPYPKPSDRFHWNSDDRYNGRREDRYTRPEDRHPRPEDRYARPVGRYNERLDDRFYRRADDRGYARSDDRYHGRLDDRTYSRREENHYDYRLSARYDEPPPRHDERQDRRYSGPNDGPYLSTMNRDHWRPMEGPSRGYQPQPIPPPDRGFYPTPQNYHFPMARTHLEGREEFKKITKEQEDKQRFGANKKHEGATLMNLPNPPSKQYKKNYYSHLRFGYPIL